MVSVKRNVLANVAGNVWLGLMGLAFVPVYLHYIGAEGYGLVGFFLMVSTLLTILDGGFGMAAARELAKSMGGGDKSAIRNLVRTLEWLFWGVAVMIGAIFIASAGWIAEQWLNVENLGPDTTVEALRLLGATLILQWPAAYYNGCILGLQRQIGLNVIQVIMATAKSAGAALILWLVSPTVQAFFAWQLLVALIHIIVLRYYLWHCMPQAASVPRFALSCVYEVGRFSVAVGGINVLALLLSQIDKIILSKILPLEQFGYYVLAATLVGMVSRLTAPVFNAVFPRLTQFVNAGEQQALVAFYHRSCQAMAVITVPLSMVLVFFGGDAIAVWTGDIDLARNLQWVVAAMAAGSMLNGVLSVPYALQLAHGWTTLSFWGNVICVILIVPLTYFLATRFGLIGAALTWPILNSLYVLLGAPLMYRRLLPAEMRHWFAYSVAIPIGAAALVMAVAKVVLQELPIDPSRPLTVLFVSCAFVVCLFLSAFLAPSVRNILVTHLTSSLPRASRASG